MILITLPPLFLLAGWLWPVEIYGRPLGDDYC